MGKGGDLSIQLNTVQGMELPPEMMLPEWNHDFLPPPWSTNWGGCPTCSCWQFWLSCCCGCAAMCASKARAESCCTGRCPDAGGAVGLCGGAESGLCAVQRPAPSGDGKSPQHGGLRPDRVGAVGLPLRVHFAGRGGSGPAAPANHKQLDQKRQGRRREPPLRPAVYNSSVGLLNRKVWFPTRPRISPLPGPHAPPAPPSCASVIGSHGIPVLSTKARAASGSAVCVSSGRVNMQPVTLSRRSTVPSSAREKRS